MRRCRSVIRLGRERYLGLFSIVFEPGVRIGSSPRKEPSATVPHGCSTVAMSPAEADEHVRNDRHDECSSISETTWFASYFCTSRYCRHRSAGSDAGKPFNQPVLVPNARNSTVRCPISEDA
jgi:hypothetical protein